MANLFDRLAEWLKPDPDRWMDDWRRPHGLVSQGVPPPVPADQLPGGIPDDPMLDYDG